MFKDSLEEVIEGTFVTAKELPHIGMPDINTTMYKYENGKGGGSARDRDVAECGRGGDRTHGCSAG